MLHKHGANEEAEKTDLKINMLIAMCQAFGGLLFMPSYTSIPCI